MFEKKHLQISSKAGVGLDKKRQSSFKSFGEIGEVPEKDENSKASISISSFESGRISTDMEEVKVPKSLINISEKIELHKKETYKLEENADTMTVDLDKLLDRMKKTKEMIQKPVTSMSIESINSNKYQKQKTIDDHLNQYLSAEGVQKMKTHIS